jgi:hypothetical protein
MSAMTAAKMVVYGSFLLLAIAIGVTLQADGLVEGSANVQTLQIIGFMTVIGSALYIPIGLFLLWYVKSEQAKKKAA